MALAVPMDSHILIIGGGVAGLSALNRFADLGVSATLVEAGSYPSHKICGEFFSPECLPQLEAWEIVPAALIHKISLNKTVDFCLPIAAGSISRFEFDYTLAQRAINKGCKILENTQVIDIKKEGSRYKVNLSIGEPLFANEVIVGTGRLFQNEAFVPRYIGFKKHCEDATLDHLQMHLIPGGYMGVSPIGNGKVNMACLMKMPFNGPLDSSWLTCKVPEFGIKKTPLLPNIYFVGDAAGTIPPASGDGLAMGIASGVMAADYALKGDWKGFRKAWKKEFTIRIYWGRVLHQIFLRPSLASCLQLFCKYFPQLPLFFFKRTRGKH